MKTKGYLLIVMFTLSLLVSGIGVEHKIYADDDIIWGTHIRNIGTVTINETETLTITGTYGIKYEGTVYNPQKNENRDVISLYIKTYANNKAYGAISFNPGNKANIGPDLMYYYMVDNGQICASYKYSLKGSDLYNIRHPSTTVNFSGAQAYIPEIGTEITKIATISLPRPWNYLGNEANADSVLGCNATGGTLTGVNGYDTTNLDENMVLGISDSGVSSSDATWTPVTGQWYIKTNGGSETASESDQEKLQEQEDKITNAQEQMNEYNELKEELSNNANEALQNWDIENDTQFLYDQKFVNTANWIRARYSDMIDGTPFETVLLLSMTIGIIVWIIGRRNK